MDITSTRMLGKLATFGGKKTIKISIVPLKAKGIVTNNALCGSRRMGQRKTSLPLKVN